MAVVNPPQFLHNSSLYSAERDRGAFSAHLVPDAAGLSWRGGVRSPNDLVVSANGTPNMTVNVSAGFAFVKGTEAALQAVYGVTNDAVLNLAIQAAHSTLNRRDIVVARVQDSQYSGSNNTSTIEVVTGTASSSPADPTLPANSLPLARITVNAGATAINTSNVTDLRTYTASIGGTITCTSSTRPATPFVGMEIFETDTNSKLFWNGSQWTYLFRSTPVRCKVFRSGANQSIPNNVTTTVLFDNEITDPYNLHSLSTNPSRITIAQAGYYEARAQIVFGTNTTGYRAVLINLSGVLVAWVRGAAATGAVSMQVQVGMQCNPSDYFEIAVQQTSGAALDLLSTATGNGVWFEVVRTGEA